MITFHNRTQLDSLRLKNMCLDAIAPWRMGRLDVRVRYSRGADFSGTCYYAGGKIYVNLGEHLAFPYVLGTFVARARTRGTRWWRPRVTIGLSDPYELVLFVFLHECYHWLIKCVGRNRRQKEAMCDRFAARVLVDQYGAQLVDTEGQPIARDEWDFQDLDAFVAAARVVPPVPIAARRPIPTPRAARVPGRRDGVQYLLF
ncbi:MAG TPA: hypothetical protein VGM03_04800 [Phycisphaerae bacterium]|jgi:hypothetical protein